MVEVVRFFLLVLIGICVWNGRRVSREIWQTGPVLVVMT